MKERICTCLVLIALAPLPLVPVFAFQQEKKGDPAPAPKKQKAVKETPGKDVFGLNKVWQFHLTVSDKDWDKMQPVSKGFPFGMGFGPKPDEKAPAEKPDVHKGSGFGTEFPWVKAEFSAEGKTYKDVGLRFKGNASYMVASKGLKRNLRIDLDHYDDEAVRFHGLKSITLNGGGMDPSRGREAFSYAVFRAAGVPAPRTAFAEVTISMPGKYDKEFVGLYTFIEHVDKTYLKDRFKNGKGVLMKPERLRDIQYLGENWESYRNQYRPKHEPSKKDAKRIIAFAKLVDKGSDEEFQKEIGNYLDIDEFLRFTAANAYVANMDSFFMLGHNYYMYLNPETNKIVFFPWDLDLSLGGFPMSGTPDQQMDLSLSHPYPGKHKLVDRLLAMKEVSAQYQKLLKELSTTAFSKERLLKEVDAIESVTTDLLAKEKKAMDGRKEVSKGMGFGPMGGMFGNKAPSLRAFVEKRTVSVLAQVAGDSKGYVPAMGFFGPGPGGPGGFGPGKGGFPPGGFGPAMMLAKPAFDVSDANKDGKLSKDELVEAARRLYKSADRDNKGAINEKDLADAINRLLPPPPGFGPGPKGGGPFPGPGNMFAGPVMKKAGVDKDGKLTLPNFIKAAESFFTEADQDKNGSLDEKEFTAALNKLVPRFGPGGFGPGPGGFPPNGPPGGFGPPPGKGPGNQPRRDEN